MVGPNLIWLDGFELADPPQTFWQRRYATAAALTTDTGRDDNGRALSFASAGPLTLVLPITGLAITPIVGFGFKFFDLLSNNLLIFKRSGTVTASLKFVRDSSTSGHLAILRGATTIAEMPAASLESDRWYYIELQASITNSGRYEVRIDMLPVLYSTVAVDLQDAGSPGIDAWEIMANGGSGSARFSIDDLYIVNAGVFSPTSFLGEIRIQGIRPESDHLAEYTPLSGTNTSNLDEDDPDGDVSYNENTLLAQKTDILHMQALEFARLSAEYIGSFVTIDHRLDVAGSVQAEFLQYDPHDNSEKVYGANVYTNTAYTLVHIAPSAQPALMERQDAAQLHFGYRSE